MGLDHEANRRITRQSRKVAQRRLRNELGKLIERRQTLARRLKRIDTVLRNLGTPEGSGGAA
jgi:chaperonin cofactor prefoldin